MVEEGLVHPLPVDSRGPRFDLKSRQILLAGSIGQVTTMPEAPGSASTNSVYILFDCRVDKKEAVSPLQKLLAELRHLLAVQRKKERKTHSWSLLRGVTVNSLNTHSTSTKQATFSTAASEAKPMFRIKEIVKQRSETKLLPPLDIYVVCWFVPIDIMRKAAPLLSDKFLATLDEEHQKQKEIDFSSFLHFSQLCSSYG